jgi:dolichol-phosphate mannosyltransferase
MSDAAPPSAVSAGLELTVVVPTFNERDNVRALIGRLVAVLTDVAWEVIFVDDDSPDGTFALIKKIAATDPRVRCIRRVKRRGLAGACIEGMLASHAAYVAVIDGDLQHDEMLLPEMLRALRGGHADIVVGSRYLLHAGREGLSPRRSAVSKLANRVAIALLRIHTTDPMSGFFMCRRDIIEEIAPRLSTQGFKILADVLVTAHARLRLLELPYTFRMRKDGVSKLDPRAALDFAELMVAKAMNDRIPVRFVTFVLVGGTGLVVHLLSLKVALSLAGFGFAVAQCLATFVAMTSNFLLNNIFTYRDQRLTGLAAVRGLLGFYLVCSVGTISNVGVASWLYSHQPVWWFAGLVGSAISSVWNFTVSATFIWRADR